MKFKYTALGFLFDLVDWIGLGLIPILFDVFDFFTMLFWITKLKAVGAIGVIEFIPFYGDVLPTNIVLGFLADKKGVK